jgi:hypothetical protein
MAPITPNLKITPTPFQPSRLGIPSSPFSPLSPITPLQRPSQQSYSLWLTTLSEEGSPPPIKPLQWLWKCHQCHQNYPLGATRRCLDDGHYFCSGTTTIRNRRLSGRPRFRRHRACTSEFDYQGWKRWANWRRERISYTSPPDIPSSPDSAISMSPSRVSKTKKHRDCWNCCDYPSECRWGTNSSLESSRITSPQTSPRSSDHVHTDSTPTTTFESIFSPSSSPSTSQSPVVQPESMSTASAADFWHSIWPTSLMRTPKGERTKVSSPLRLNPVLEEGDGSDSAPKSSSIDITEGRSADEVTDTSVLDWSMDAGSSKAEFDMPSLQVGGRLSRFREDVGADTGGAGEPPSAVQVREDSEHMYGTPRFDPQSKSRNGR